MNRNFEMINTNGVTLRCVVEGQGPLVILLHGWPQCWYLWRHQIDPLIAAGYKVVVPDQRGFAGSSKPEPVDAYHIKQLTADIEGIRSALGYDDFIVIGQDWGCLVAWFTALLYPDTCRAVMGLSVPFWRFSDEWINRPGMEDRFWYMRYFQPLGVAEAELDADIARSLKTIYHALCADSAPGTWLAQLDHPNSCGLLDALPQPGAFSDWLSPADLDYYIAQYENDGFRAPINWYRNILAGADYLKQLGQLRFRQPAAFGIGEVDDVRNYDPNWQERFADDFDDLRFSEIIAKAGHWLQAEQPDAVNSFILKFLRGL